MLRRIPAILCSLVSLRFIRSPLWIYCFIMLGVMAGLGLAVAKVSRIGSYAGDEPETCVNCHVMQPHYASWQRSSHAGVATCNDCHVPHDHFINKYAFKARDGLYHSAIFTLRMEPQVIHTSRAAIPVIEGNCRRCHEQTIQDVSLCCPKAGDHRCWDCHREVPHGRVRSLSATPRISSPQLPPVLSPDAPRIGGRKTRPESGANP